MAVNWSKVGRLLDVALRVGILLAPVYVACIGWTLLKPETFYQRVGTFAFCIIVWYFLTVSVVNVLVRLRSR